MVRLVRSSTLPGRKGRFLEVAVDGPVKKGDELLFEPNTLALKELGLSCQEAFLKVGVGGQVLVPLQNFMRDDVKLDGGTELGCVELFGCDVVMLWSLMALWSLMTLWSLMVVWHQLVVLKYLFGPKCE